MYCGIMLDWSRAPVRVGGFIISGAGGAVVASVAGLGPLGIVGLVVVGLGVVFVGDWWWRRGFAFPDTLEPHVRRVTEVPGMVWGVDLDFRNPGRTDIFEVRYEAVGGVESAGATPGSYLNWRGDTTHQDAKEVRRGDTARLFLCQVGPRIDGDPVVDEDVAAPSGTTGLDLRYDVVTDSSTGSVIHVPSEDEPSLPSTDEPEPVDSDEEGERREWIYRVRALSHATGDTAVYEIRVLGPDEETWAAPEVDVDRLKSRVAPSGS